MTPYNHARETISASCLYLVGVLVASLGGLELRSEDGAMLVTPQALHAGGESAITLSTFEAESRASHSRTATVWLVAADGTRVATLFSGATGEDGHERASFDVPDLSAGAYTIEAEIVGISDTLQTTTSLESAPGILIETDKPIYKPAQTIQGRVILVNNSLTPVAGDVEVLFHDGKGIRIHREQLTTNEFGVAPFSLQLASEVNFGTWKIRALRMPGALSRLVVVWSVSRGPQLLRVQRLLVNPLSALR